MFLSIDSITCPKVRPTQWYQGVDAEAEAATCDCIYGVSSMVQVARFHTDTATILSEQPHDVHEVGPPCLEGDRIQIQIICYFCHLYRILYITFHFL